ncbi:hypothetical protein C1H46_001705 [Malus baccata]|uniref:Uncharacterized protein n=1 Tax=Malus baccata TaxID=106549 RepID=A0A540NNT3_MALBA|nr:hypothetical protein C1H46_001705 [Malus baccata]
MDTPCACNSYDSSGLQKWEEVLDMFNDLIDWLKNERELLVSVAKLEVMKERLSREDVLTDKSGSEILKWMYAMRFIDVLVRMVSACAWEGL